MKSKLPASVGTDSFNGTSWKYTKSGKVMKVTFNNGVMEVSESNKKDATYYYSCDATNKRLYYIFRTKWDYGKEYTSVEAYAKKMINLFLTLPDALLIMLKHVENGRQSGLSRLILFLTKRLNQELQSSLTSTIL